MGTATKLTGAEFDSMVERGAFDVIAPKKVELIRGELRFMNPAGPIHDDHIQYLTDWSYEQTRRNEVTIRVQTGFVCDEDRPEPDVLWIRPGRYGRTRPTAADVMLLIEVSDSSLVTDLREKADLYASSGVAEYWVVDIPGQRIHMMSSATNGQYERVQICDPPGLIAPKCKPLAKLATAELFAVD